MPMIFSRFLTASPRPPASSAMPPARRLPLPPLPFFLPFEDEPGSAEVSADIAFWEVDCCGLRRLGRLGRPGMLGRPAPAARGGRVGRPGRPKRPCVAGVWRPKRPCVAGVGRRPSRDGVWGLVRVGIESLLRGGFGPPYPDPHRQPTGKSPPPPSRGRRGQTLVGWVGSDPGRRVRGAAAG